MASTPRLECPEAVSYINQCLKRTALAAGLPRFNIPRVGEFCGLMKRNKGVVITSSQRQAR